eukprot:Gregarina_sp_Poly_1__4615@NODE_246_length_10752_cov_151_576135_g216_i0_p12_GENE_NODE_246_length_10752_cov_151_576135_g216_i0NODE_246_length_10752_cov_151_576135_g216_i0_p12_ORF_typecomplete_len151_score11_15SfLAP/PF11139_8/0_0069Colicin_V/PF02674_16/1_2Colicin_V/PF02674_16/6_1e03Colicin_V/PF02674_16/7_5DUF1700/PF08006_11/4e02DUF1700/PF08006_11/0_84CbiQ/PF02361_16/2_7e02CbiQ/PF02361_16/5_7DUF202/PF02656_15/19DUF202/PF02656_15/3_2e02_NODE_246_length_10752_cov_151_576135_g216_i082978749
MRKGSGLQNISRWLGFVVGLLTLILGLVHFFDSKPRLRWPAGRFRDDNNASSWRWTLFSFAPSIFIDNWTPAVFGVVGLVAHFGKHAGPCGFVTKDFLSYAIFLLIVALFANLAYNGGLGIIFSIVSFLATLLCFITAFSQQDSASLDLF